ncbi:hypothetical protein PanWU01x14_119680 [Parasponia andersonii]|uniref:Uncharacterized protein n=1 Tax=Parasponia andersonii TaxID=3476 RepID=A0A2P5CVN4_PARAD|nr:hypothetical protein PanWU01x14_119680 [Parasponia andersonii]
MAPSKLKHQHNQAASMNSLSDSRADIVAGGRHVSKSMLPPASRPG